MAAYRETDSLDCWVRSVFEEAWEVTNGLDCVAEIEYEKDRLRSLLENAESLQNWAETYLRLAMPGVLNTLFQAVVNSIDWWSLRHTLFEYVEERDRLEGR